jgi:hypothetical protein
VDTADLIRGDDIVAVVGRWQLHPLHLYLVRTYLQLDDLTLPLDSPAFGSTLDQVGELARREAPTMESLGILVDDEVQPGLEKALRVLTKPFLWLDSLWFPSLERNFMWRTVAVLAEEDRIVLGVQTPGESEGRGGMLTVEVHEKAPLSQVIMPTLPPAPPGRHSAITVPASSFRQAQPAEEEDTNSFMLRTGSRHQSSGDRQLAAYKAIGAAQHVRGGQIAANLRQPHGTVTRSTILKWFDNAEPDGRYLDHNERGRTGEQVYMITPVDGGQLRSKVDELIKEVRTRH